MFKMNDSKKPGGGDPPRPAPRRFRFGSTTPSSAAVEELAWFFNDAESQMGEPSSYGRMIAGARAEAAEDVERRAEALRAARTINDRLASLHTAQALLLAGVFTERAWPRRVERALGVLAGGVEASATVRAEYLCALMRARTRAEDVAAWLEELVTSEGSEAVAGWRREVEGQCAVAMALYERARRQGPSVVPGEGEGA